MKDKDPNRVQVYITNLDAYNQGHYVGFWLAINGKTAEEMSEEIAAYFANFPRFSGEEWRIDDTDPSLPQSEYLSLTHLETLADHLLAENDLENLLLVWRELLNLDEAIEAAEDRLLFFDDAYDACHYFFPEMDELDDRGFQYIDYDAAWGDIKLLHTLLNNPSSMTDEVILLTN